MITPHTSGPGPQIDAFTGRLRAWPVSSWRHGDRAARTRRALQELADLAAPQPGEHPVPDLGAHVLADQLVVLVRAARDAGVEEDRLAGLLDALAGDLGLRR
ncbi:hypothetical protein JL107_10510 [Nakamurella flavida]|uniref:Uncharacterized protein n=1 Tax=Nakamurella flavida TaxID=363630 RepID=A0A939C0M6_9ACTN|nr:hypothetical protein [Nakamurella flavida]MBM9476878.1 hypothetical protein [Nakamurella flavida]MDP9779822.1 hypothetical protein [Nakamurella flavida]